MALTSVAMLESVRSVADEFSAMTFPLSRAEKAHPDFLFLVTEPSVNTMRSPTRLFSSMRVSTSACAAPGAHSLHSLPRVEITVVNCSVGSSTAFQASPLLTFWTEVHESIVLAACVSHSLPLLSLHFAFRPILSCRGLLVYAATLR